MKLENAKYCLDCDCVFDRADCDTCPDCASDVTVGLTSWIGGPLRMIVPAASVKAGDHQVGRPAGRPYEMTGETGPYVDVDIAEPEAA